MARKLMVLAVGGLLLSGCQSPDESAANLAYADPDCSAAAAARAQDAGYNGYDAAMQQAIYTGAYKQCLHTKSKAVLLGPFAERSDK